MKKIFRNNINTILSVLLIMSMLFSMLFYAFPKINFTFAAGEEVAVENVILNNGSRLVAKIDGASYQWKISDAENGTYESISGATQKYYDITAEDEGKYIKVSVNGADTAPVGPIGKLITFDLAKGSITLGATYSGKGSNDNNVSGNHVATNIYVITQSNNETSTTNGITINPSSYIYNVTLDGINIYETFAPGTPGNGPMVKNYFSCINIPAASQSINVMLRVKGENSVRGIHYTGNNSNSFLTITDVNGNGETSGSLYIPKKVDLEDIDGFIKENTNHNLWNAGLGGDDSNANVKGLTIAGGNIQVLTTYGDNCTAIGGGGNGVGDISITGGNVYAACNGTGAAIGGGIGWNSAGGRSNVTISGGKVYAKNYGENVSEGMTVGGVAIGAGSSFKESGSQGNVTITGGEVEAYGTYGNGIGGGNSSKATGGSSTITISGGTVKTNALGGGSSSSKSGGSATINISGGTVTAGSIGGGNSQVGVGGTATVNISGTADVTLTDDKTQLGSDAPESTTIATYTGGIGGGNSANGNGGGATINVDSGSLQCSGGIGGGQAGGTGNGGDATITVTNGKLTATTIGGGTGSGTGNGGAANVTINGGEMIATTIGGGLGGGANGALGNATANIKGGEITGQFIMADGAADCTFTMTGGTLHGVDATSGKYAQTNGGAVYMNDPQGTVSISGGTIEGGKAVNGGAIYMTEGTFTLSSTGAITGCEATQNGGAVYLGGGKVIVEGGSILNNIAQNGGAIYMTAGTFTMSGGSISGNTANDDGGALYLNASDGTVDISGGTISGGEAENGGAIYMTAGTFTLSGTGAITDCEATQNGGAVYLGGGSITVSGGSITDNTAPLSGGAVYMQNGTFMISGGSITGNTTSQDGGGVYLGGGSVSISGGSISNNTAAENGGGIYIGNGSLRMSGGALDYNVATNGAGGGAYVKGNDNIAIEILSGSISNNTAKTKGGGVAVVGESNTDLQIIVGINEPHTDAEGNKINCDHDTEVEGLQGTCPVIKKNKVIGAGSEGGAFYITGGYKTELDIYCLDTSNNRADANNDDITESKSDFMKVDGGNVLISTIKKGSNGEEIANNSGMVVISGSFHVEAGQVKVDGTTSNPMFEGTLTVDIKNPSTDESGDYFDDNRTFDGYFIIQYFENFQNSGRYVTFTEKAVEGTAPHTIQSVPYSHEGHLIEGWYRMVNGVKGEVYKVGTQITLTEADQKGLILYAEWSANAYTVKYDPNVPAGTSIQGEMASQTAAYGTPFTLNKNNFIYAGYAFQGWSLTKGGEVKYLDGVKVEENLASSAGAVVTLYAVWAECTHTLTYSASGNVLTRKCLVCHGYTETATLTAQNAVYDGSAHGAEIAYSKTVAVLDFAEWVLPIAYSGTYLGSDLTPTNAGTYTASIMDGGKTVSITYTIDKADQAAPKKPTYPPPNEDGNDNNIIIIDSHNGKTADGQDGHGAIQYKVVYYNNGVKTDLSDWREGNDLSKRTFSLSIAYTNYFIMVRFAGNDNYNPSAESIADAVFYFTGYVTLNLSWDDGLSCIVENMSDNVGQDGIIISCTLSEGYYNAGLNATLTSSNGSPVGMFNETKYHITGIATGTEGNPTLLDVHISGAAKQVIVNSTITAGQVFDDVTGADASIGNDSAYTAYFEVLNYAGYSGLSLTFSQNLPSLTTIILIDKIGETPSYYYYNVSESATPNTIALTAFKAMSDGTTLYSITGTTLKYQFIIDFSRSAGCSGTSLTTGLTATTTASGAPAFPTTAGVETVIKSVKFELKESSTNETEGLEESLNVTYGQSEGEVSKWEDRQAVLVLEKTNDSAALPFEAFVKVIETNDNTSSTTDYYQTSPGQFILPLRSLSVGEENVTITLESNLFPEAGATYAFSATLYASNSEVGSAPLNGEKKGTTPLTFTVVEKTTPSLKVESNRRVYALSDTLNATITTAGLPTEYEITADLMFKSVNAGKETYSSTAFNQEDIKVDGNGTATITIAWTEATNLAENSYCLLVTVRDGSGALILSVPYYFLISKNATATTN